MTDNVRPPIDYVPLIRPGVFAAVDGWTKFMWPQRRGFFIVWGWLFWAWLIFVALKVYIWAVVLVVLLVVAGVFALVELATFRHRLRRARELEQQL